MSFTIRSSWRRRRGPSAPALAAAVSEAGGFGFLAAGYLSADAMRDDIRALREQTSAPFGVNIFVPGRPDVDERAVRSYVERLEAEEATRERGDADGFNHWAGQTHRLAKETPAANIVRTLASEARVALERAVTGEGVRSTKLLRARGAPPG